MPLQAAAAMAVAAPSKRAEQNVSALVESKLFQLCRLFLHRGMPTQDQLQEARIAATLALRDYNPSLGAFTTLLAIYVRKALFRSQSAMIRIPEHMMIRMNKLDALRAEYLYRLDRPPTEEEIADDLGLTPLQVQELHQTISVVIDCREDQPAPDLLEAAETKIDVRRALEALEAIDPEAAEVARMHYLEGKTHRTMRATLRIRTTRMLERLETAKNFLQKNLEAYA